MPENVFDLVASRPKLPVVQNLLDSQVASEARRDLCQLVGTDPVSRNRTLEGLLNLASRSPASLSADVAEYQLPYLHGMLGARTSEPCPSAASRKQTDENIAGR